MTTDTFLFLFVFGTLSMARLSYSNKRFLALSVSLSMSIGAIQVPALPFFSVWADSLDKRPDINIAQSTPQSPQILEAEAPFDWTMLAEEAEESVKDSGESSEVKTIPDIPVFPTGTFELLGDQINTPKPPAILEIEDETVSVYEKTARTVVTVKSLLGNLPSTGAGVIVDGRGLILTSRHVLGESHWVSVTLENGDKYRGEVIKSLQSPVDMALIRIHPKMPLPTITLGDSDRVKVGQRVMAIGNPYGFERTLTVGIISRWDKTRNRFQTDAAINPGNSGGPLLNRRGEMIAISQSIYNPEGSQANIGIGFAAPINIAKPMLQEVLTSKIWTTPLTQMAQSKP
jgi:S1-C subfamily serine protease